MKTALLRLVAAAGVAGAVLLVPATIAHACDDGGYWDCTVYDFGTYCVWYPG